jgi:excisionase family DNA binding protein
MPSAQSSPFASTPRPQPAPIEKLLTLDEAAELIGVSRRTVNRLKADGELKTITIGPFVVRVDPRDLRAFLDARKS